MGEPTWWLAFLAGLGVGSAFGALHTLNRVEAFFGTEAFRRFLRAERDTFMREAAPPDVHFANPS